MKSRVLSVFMTNSIGLWNWKKKGLLSRELSLYNKISEAGWGIRIYSYDRTRKLPSLPKQFMAVQQWPVIIPRKINFIYELLLPFIHYCSGRRSTHIITNQAHGGWPAIIAAKMWRTQLIARCGMVLGERLEDFEKIGIRLKIRKYLEKKTFAYADQCIVPTKHHAEWIVNHYNINHKKINVIPNYVDFDLFNLDHNATKQYDIIYVGRFVDVKNHRLLIDSAKEKDWKILLVGDGPLRSEIEKYAAEYKINCRIINAVPNAQLPSLLRSSKLFVSTSRREGHPKALIEAMACGCACVATKAPGVINIINDGENGVLVDPNAIELMKAIDYVLDDDKFRINLSLAASAYARELFSLEKVSEMYLSVFKKVLNKPLN